MRLCEQNREAVRAAADNLAASSVLNSRVKASNPKDMIGSKKVPFYLIPAQVLGELALALLEGACKYGAYNYRVIGVRASVYDAACERHMKAWREGEDDDPDSGLSHVTKAIACLVVLRDAMMNDKWVDDRPPSIARQDWIQDLNKKAEEILSRYPNPKEPYTKEASNAQE